MARQTDPIYLPYVRVSKAGGREGESYISIPEQLREIRRAASQAGVTLSEQVYEDEDRSGGNVNREAFQAALDLVRDGQAAGIVVAKLDRFSRDVEDFLATVREIEALGGRLICGDGPVSLQNGTDAFVATIRAAAGEFFLAERTQYLNDTRRNAIERGVHLAIPFGYYRPEPGTPLAEDPREGPVVRSAFRLRAEGLSYPAIAKRMNAGEVKPRPFNRTTRTPSGEKTTVRKQGRWSPKTIRAMVASEVYLGIAHSGDLRNENAHPALVSRADFAKANETRGVVTLGPTEGYLLSGLVRCGACGYALVHAVPRKDARYYVCQTRQGSGECPHPASANAYDLERYVRERIGREYLGIEAVQVSADDLGVSEAQEELASATDDLERALENYERLGSLSKTEEKLVVARLERARLRVRNAEQELSRAVRNAQGVQLPDGLDLDGFDSAPIPRRRHFLSLVYGAVVVHPSRYWREPVSERTLVLGAKETPTDKAGLIETCRSLDWNPPRPRMEVG